MDRKVIILLTLISTFLAIISLMTLYIHIYLKFSYCGFPIELMIPVTASFGMFIGSFIYYIFSERNKKEYSLKNIMALLRERERKVLKKIVEKKRIRFSELARETNLPKPTLYRILRRLENAKLIKITKENRKVLIELV